jgi:hypothetical protein
MSKATNIASLLTANGRVKAEKSGSAGAPVRVDFTATENQTTKTGLTYTVGDIDCYINGSKMMIDADFTASDGVSVTFAVALNLGDEVQLIMGVAMGSGVAPIATGGTVSITDGSTGGGAVSYDVNANFSFSTGSIFSSYAVQSGALPTGTSLDTATGVISGTVANATAAYPFTIRATDTDYDIVDQLYSWDFTYLAQVGESVYTTGGTFSWTAPADVTLVSVICVGGGGGGDNQLAGTNGTDSSFLATTGEGGLARSSGGGFTGDGGGAGGDGGSGAGGAGGYIGDTGGGGNTTQYGGGGGVGIFGMGATGGITSGFGGGGGGSGGTNGLSYSESNGGTYGGGGGSGGTNAGGGAGLGWSNDVSVSPGSSYTVEVGTGGGGYMLGGGGAVRIIWGPGRSFPSNAS